MFPPPLPVFRVYRVTWERYTCALGPVYIWSDYLISRVARRESFLSATMITEHPDELSCASISLILELV